MIKIYIFTVVMVRDRKNLNVNHCNLIRYNFSISHHHRRSYQFRGFVIYSFLTFRSLMFISRKLARICYVRRSY